MKWITNIFDPTKPRVIKRMEDESKLMKWLEGKIIGEPKETDEFTVDELKARGIAGVYVRDEGE